MAGRRRKKSHAGIHRATLGIGRAVIQPPDPCKRNRAGAHRARLQRDIEVAIDQPLGADGLGGLPDRQDFSMGGRIAVGQGAVAGRGDHLVIPDNDASNRNFARFSGVFRRFQRQIHERGRGHASYHRKKPATRNPCSKSGYRFCVRLRLELGSACLAVMPVVRVSLIANSSLPETRPFMPRDNDKNNDSRGRRDRPSGGKGRSGASRGPEKKFAKRGFAGKSDGERKPYAGKSDGPRTYGKKPYSGPGEPYAGKREGPPPRRDGDAPRRDYGDAPRPPRFNRDDRPAHGGGEK